MVRPSRMIVTESAIASISLSLWQMMIEVMPWLSQLADAGRAGARSPRR